LPKAQLIAGAVFFALAGAATVMLRQPLDFIGWGVLLACVAFVALAVVGMVKPQLSSRGLFSRTKRKPPVGFEIGAYENPAPVPARRMPSGSSGEPLIGVEAGGYQLQSPAREPTTSELQVLTDTIAALEAVGGLNAGEIDALSLWNASEEIDPGRAIGIDEAIGSFAALYDLGRSRFGRMTFVPAHTEYDAPLLAEITASVLTSLGHNFRPEEIVVTLPPDGQQGRASIAFSLAGRIETVTFSYLWKYPPADLLPGLRSFSTRDDPRELVGAHPGDQTLLYVAIREGALDQLNALLPADTEMFYEV